MFILLAALTIFSTFINAPLRELANPNLTPNPSKAPWYFLGLQELLRYFHPMVAGITIPTFILVGLAAVPFVDRNPSTKPGRPQDRHHAVHDAVHVRRHADDHRLLLPRPRLQLDLAVGAGGVLRPVTTLALSAAARRRIVALVVLDLFAIVVRALVRAARKAPAGTPPPPGAAAGAAAASAPKAVSPPRLLPQVPARLARRVRGAVRRRHARVPVAEPQGRVRLGHQRRRARRHQGQIAHADDRSTTAPGRFYLVPVQRQGQRRRRLRARGRHRRGHHAAVPALRAPGLPRAVLRLQSKWFECPCHGSKYNDAGEYQLGPAPRGMDRFKITVDGSGNVFVDTSEVVLGPPRGTDTINEPPAGPVLRGAGIGDERRTCWHCRRPLGIALLISGARAGRDRARRRCSCADGRASAAPTSRARCGPGPPTRRWRRRCCRSSRAGACVLVAFFVVWIPFTWLREPSDNLAAGGGPEDARRSSAGRAPSSCSPRRTRPGSAASAATARSCRGGIIQTGDPDGSSSTPTRRTSRRSAADPRTGHAPIYRSTTSTRRSSRAG